MVARRKQRLTVMPVQPTGPMRGYKRLAGRQLSVVSGGSTVTLANVNMNIKRKVGDKLAKELVIQGDCLDVLKTFEDNSVDSVVTDPPYGLSKEPNIREVLTKWLNGEPYDHSHGGFMGKSWDSFVPHPDIWKEVYRVLKPGGHALVFAGTRTQDLMTISLRLAGFEVRDVIEFLYFSGFPKSLDVSKAFDRRAGAEREVIGLSSAPNGKQGGYIGDRYKEKRVTPFGVVQDQPTKTAPATDLAKKWDGWGTALKPAHEPIIMVRKPLIDADTGCKLTVIDCVEKYGTGAINIDGCRIGESGARNNGSKPREDGYAKNNIYGKYRPMERIDYGKGRFPANCITLESDAFYSKYFNISPPELSKKASKKDRNSDWRGEPINLTPKTKRAEDGMKVDNTLKDPTNMLGPDKITCSPNNHPTVKNTNLMAWLARLITPPGGIVLDPFAGSGSTLVAAKREGFGFIGIEREPEYVKIIEARTHVKAIKTADDKDKSIVSHPQGM